MYTVYEFPRALSKPIIGDPYPYSLGIMFSPNGGIDSIWINGQRNLDASRVFFLLGRGENGNPPVALYTDWGRGGQGQTKNMSNEEFKDRQSKVNWLNLDSRWLMVNGNDGRVTATQNALVDPRTNPDDDTRDVDAIVALEAQIEAAHALAHQHSDGGARN